ncbi:beta-ketoacyl-ACP synthase 3 [Streptomyces formicae]|uniref:3-oxoacyl-[acyl-carrier-protein] synthase, KASIII n=1 Tax=Streptomyces formicae TaxID=1616117 RepID=A0A291Q2B7_9ACTN|nr:beta-ketoacyl-ACP synthase 3 [Streptomyces formicae]ATL25626.1 3-oxoacyl-[acyl-carrier-protein] synthase, KASIII [Streptomyces formicae]
MDEKLKLQGAAVAASSLSPSAGSRIDGLGAYRPVAVVTNEEAATAAGVSPEWISNRVGVEERSHAREAETVVTMAVAAGKEALADCDATADDVDVVLLSTCSMPSPMPNGAASTAAAIGCTAAAGFDLNAACSGFCHGLAVADALVRAGTARSVLVIGSERMTDWVAPEDRDTGPIFADGAAAALVVPSAEPAIFPVAWGSDGTHSDLIRIPSETSRMEMAGRKVFRWTTSELAAVMQVACERAGLEPADLRAFVPHQANLRIIEALRQGLGAPDLVTATDVTNAGNTSAASVPLALHALRQRGDVSRGDPVLLFGFGAGLCYAAQVVLCP